MEGLDSVFELKQIMAEKELTWTTWEELLLACAVKRHGLNDWDSVAMELQHRSSLPLLLTAQVCENKYHDLKRRFMDTTDNEHDDEVDSIPWLEELRKLRVAELKQEVHRYDISIHSLQLKVKRLEEEREKSLKEDKYEDEKPDLEKDWEKRLENEKSNGARAQEEVSSEQPAGVGSEMENRSFNESNSKESREAALNEERRESEPVETADVKPDPAPSDSKLTGEESYNDSSGTVAKNTAARPIQEKKGGDPAEFRNSADESKEGTNESSDVQSTACLARNRRHEKEVSGWSSAGAGNEPTISPANIKRKAMKSEPLVGLLDIIRSHKHGSVFECRLENQKTDEYKNMIRHHVDLETIRTRLDEGSYSSCTSKFYLDVLLLLTNAVVFFHKGCPESVAANELRDLIFKEMIKNRTQRSDSSPEPPRSKPDLLQPKPDPEGSYSVLANHKSSVPIVVCRKRSYISAKASNTTNKLEEKQTKEKPTLNPHPPVKTSSNAKNEQSPTKVKTKERTVTGTRSLRRSSKGRTNSTPSTNHQTVTIPGSNTGASADKGEAPKTNKKKTDSKVKKQGAADFLKRIKQNSPLKGTLLNTVKSKGSDGNSGGRKEKKKRGDGRKEAPVSKRRNGGRRMKKEISSPGKRDVGRTPTKRRREGSEAEVASKRGKKRSRR